MYIFRGKKQNTPTTTKPENKPSPKMPGHSKVRNVVKAKPCYEPKRFEQRPGFPGQPKTKLVVQPKHPGVVFVTCTWNAGVVT